jgi:Ni,Fe-hydrogenase maturation factor
MTKYDVLNDTIRRSARHRDAMHRVSTMKLIQYLKVIIGDYRQFKMCYLFGKEYFEMFYKVFKNTSSLITYHLSLITFISPMPINAAQKNGWAFG